MSKCTLMFEDDEIAKIAEVEQLVIDLTQIRNTFSPHNPLVELVHENGNVLTLGISSSGCYINYADKSGNPPYYSSLGDHTLSNDDGTVSFKMSRIGHVSEILKRNVITFEELLRTSTAFFVNGERPAETIAWEID